MMNRSFETALFLLTCLSVALPLSGCSVSVDPNSIQRESLVHYAGRKQSVKVAYAGTEAVHVFSIDGNVSVSVGEGDQFEIEFSPFTLDKKDQEQRAVSEIEGLLSLSAVKMGDLIVKVERKDGASGYLGADIDIVLPKTFVTPFHVEQSRGRVDADFGSAAVPEILVASDGGDVNVKNARGRLGIVTDEGDVHVDVDAWATANGAVVSKNGDLDFSMPRDVNGVLSVSAKGDLIEQNVPSTWTKALEDSATVYTMGNGLSGARVDLVAKFGDIALTVK